MKQKNLFMAILLALIILPMGTWAATVQYTDPTTGIMYNVKTSSSNTPQVAVVYGWDGTAINVGTQLKPPAGSVSLTIPASLTFQSTTIPVIGIESVSFKGQPSEGNIYLKSVVVGANVTTIRENAFKNIINLSSVTLPNSLTTIGATAFQGCTALTSVDIPASVTSIGNNAFDCGNTLDVYVNWMVPVDFPSGTDPFPNRRVEGHVLHAPFGVSSSYSNHSYWGTFESVQSPATYTASNGIIYDWVEDGTNLAVVSWTGWTSEVGVLVESPLVIGDHTFTVTEIADNAFSECPYLNSITIPSSVTKIGEHAFVRSGLTLVEFEDNGLLEIGFNAFNGCAKLQSITIPSTVTTIDGGAFNNSV